VEALIFISFLAEKIFEIEIINKDYAALRGITTDLYNNWTALAYSPLRR